MFRTNHARKLAASAQNAVLAPSIYHRIMENFPEGIQMAFAYGSGVFQQEGHQDMSKNMLDFVFTVDNPQMWHQENIKKNRKHYSFLKTFGPRYVARVQDKFGAGVYFNTLVSLEDRVIKYGVISTERLITDLLDWDTLYISGRLHKPARLVIIPKNKNLISAMHINLESAVHAALLLLPETFSEEELYLKITSLSYRGDFRMKVGEDKNKIKNIVKPSIEHFRKMYGGILDKEDHVYWHKSQGTLEQYPNQTTQYHHLSLLPKTIQMTFLKSGTKFGNYPDLEEVLRQLANDSHCDDLVHSALEEIVKGSSWSQSVKSIFTAGVLKSVKYSTNKLRKMFRSRNKK